MYIVPDSQTIRTLVHYNIILYSLHRGKRACPCQSSPSYGGSSGRAFADHPVNPCGADIIRVSIRQGIIIDSIQMTYKSWSDEVTTGPQHGGNGGDETSFELGDGEYIMAVFGLYRDMNYGVVAITSLTFLSMDAEGAVHIHGPYGSVVATTSIRSDAVRGLFAVAGKIHSIYGRTESGYLQSIGFNYEPLGY